MDRSLVLVLSRLATVCRIIFQFGAGIVISSLLVEGKDIKIYGLIHGIRMKMNSFAKISVS